MTTDIFESLLLDGDAVMRTPNISPTKNRFLFTQIMLITPE